MGQAEIFTHLEAWWGSRLDAELIHTIAQAPSKQLVAFSDSLEEIGESPPTVRPAHLRPAVAESWFVESPDQQLATALRLLLYSHEVVLDAHDLDELKFIYRTGVNSQKRAQIAASLARLSVARPLIENGSMHWASLQSRGRHPALSLLYRQASNDPQVREVIRTFAEENDLDIGDDSESIRDALYSFVSNVAGASTLASVQKAHTLARSHLDEVVLDAFLGQVRIADQRQLRLMALARLQVPRVEGDIKSLVRLRESGDQFAEWRQGLGRALDIVATLPDRDDGGREAAAVVREELRESFAQLTSANRRSPVVQAAIGGVTGFAVTGVSAVTTGVMTGNPFVALAAGAAGKIADGLVSYAKAVGERNRARSILDVAVTFNEGTIRS